MRARSVCYDWKAGRQYMRAGVGKFKTMPLPQDNLTTDSTLGSDCHFLLRRQFVGSGKRIPVGTRIKLSELGAIRCPRLSGKLGIVVGWSPYRSSLSVLFDGNKTPTALHPDYLEPEHSQGTKRMPD